MEKLIFNLITPSETIFGAGRIAEIPNLIKRFGDHVLLITGSYSLKTSGKLDEIKSLLWNNNIKFSNESISGEPTPQTIDNITSKYHDEEIDVIVSIGGGSVIDAGKAVSSMLCETGSVRDFLEGVGTRQVSGKKIPFVAVPTTSGTGSEATKNAVICEKGDNGFKKSLRHNNFVPDIALIDPEFTVDLPRAITASTGMDALSQLIESYISSGSNMYTDSLAENALKIAGESLPALIINNSASIEYKSGMAYASYISGIILANAGLTIIHGISGSIGGFFDAPHGTLCGTILPSGIDLIFQKSIENKNIFESTLQKLSNIYIYISGEDNNEVIKNCENLIRMLYNYKELFKIPGLSKLGISQNNFDKIAENSGIKNTPVNINKKDIVKILELSI